MRTSLLGFWIVSVALVACGGDGDGGDADGTGGSGTGGSGTGGVGGTGGTAGAAATGGLAGSASGGSSGSAGSGATAGTSSGGSAGSGGSGTNGPSSWIGVPNPPFGLTETASGCTGCSQTTANGPGDLTNLAAGTIVELSSSFSCSGNVIISGQGTATQPIFVRGPSPTQKVKIPCATGVMGSYIIVENVDFDFTGKDIAFGFVDSDHVALRSSDVHGVRANSNGTVVVMQDSSDVVLYENSIFDNGDFSVAGELDIHGVGGSNVWRVWVLNNELYSNRGDSIQFGHNASNTLGDIYIAGNDMYDNGENSVDIKEASNVVISQNKLHGDNPLGNVVLHDCPINAAVIYNEIYDESVGVSMASLESGCAGSPVSLFVLKNDFHDIGETGVQGWGSGKRYFVAGNTFQSVATAIEIDNAGSGSVITEGDTGLAQGFTEFQSVYGLDISKP